MRQPTDLCLLCQVNPAIKTNSHIFPRYLSTSFLGSPRRGYDLDTSTALDKKSKIIQDSPKENYILCDDCEAYFSLLEVISSDLMINWRDKVANGEYKSVPILSEFRIVECTTANALALRLLIYSIFWRASISELEFFDNFKIEANFEEELRQSLMGYQAITKQDFLNKVANTPSPVIFPFNIMTAESFTEDTANLLLANFTYDPYCLNCDIYNFMLFHSKGDIKEQFIIDFSNHDISHAKLMVFSPRSWHNTIVKPAFEMFAKQAINKKKESGEQKKT